MLREEIGQMKRERYRGSFGKAASEEVFLYWELRQRSCDSSDILNTWRPVTGIVLNQNAKFSWILETTNIKEISLIEVSELPGIALGS